VRRFLPGEDLSAALAAAAQLAQAGIGALLTQLGEQVTSPAEAARVRDHYRDALDRMRAAGLPLPAQISVKLTHLGLDVDREACARHLLELARHAGETGSFVWIDMEESRYVDVTLELFRRACAVHDNVGVCLQAYLRRTPADLESLWPLRPAIRLVKGAYNEPPALAYPSKRDVDACYRALAAELLERAARSQASPVFGTHDRRIIAEVAARAAAHGLARGAYEVHMLYGIRSAEQRALAAAGIVVRVLISYGSAWFAWYMRRLAERPANVWFVLRSLA